VAPFVASGQIFWPGPLGRPCRRLRPHGEFYVFAFARLRLPLTRPHPRHTRVATRPAARLSSCVGLCVCLSSRPDRAVRARRSGDTPHRTGVGWGVVIASHPSSAFRSARSAPLWSVSVTRDATAGRPARPLPRRPRTRGWLARGAAGCTRAPPAARPRAARSAPIPGVRSSEGCASCGASHEHEHEHVQSMSCGVCGVEWGGAALRDRRRAESAAAHPDPPSASVRSGAASATRSRPVATRQTESRRRRYTYRNGRCRSSKQRRVAAIVRAAGKHRRLRHCRLWHRRVSHRRLRHRRLHDALRGARGRGHL